MNEQVIHEVIRRVNAKHSTDEDLSEMGYVKLYGDGSWEVGYGMDCIRIGDSMDELSLFLEEIRK